MKNMAIKNGGFSTKPVIRKTASGISKPVPPKAPSSVAKPVARVGKPGPSMQRKAR